MVLTLLLEPARTGLEFASIVLLYLGLIVVTSAAGGLLAGLVTAFVAFAVTNFFFTEPLRTWSISDPREVVALVVFVLVGAVVSVLVDVAARRSAEATRARAEAAALSDLARVLLDSDRPLRQFVDNLRATLQARSVALLRREADAWIVEASAGAPVPNTPDDGTEAIEVSTDTVLVVDGPQALAEDRRILTAFAAQLTVALESRTLARAAANAGALQQARDFRNALLAAVSHDLRTPLASVKAAATSLQQTDVELTLEDREEFVDTIVTEIDRLNGLVGNLLDMSRIHSGVVDVMNVPVGLDEVVPAAIPADDQDRVDVDVAESLPSVQADPGLLERIIANLVTNAIRWSPSGTRVRIVAGPVPGGIDLRIIDRGPGIAVEARGRVFEPFQRTGDDRTSDGIGLGLAVARGFAEAIGASLEIDDTPGGGTTMVLHLRTAPSPQRAPLAGGPPLDHEHVVRAQARGSSP
jgi:two-component system sensor histidine kinase KdpD